LVFNIYIFVRTNLKLNDMKKINSVLFFNLLFVFIMNTAYSQILPVSNCDFSANCTSVHLDTIIPSNIWRIGQTTKTDFLPSTRAIVTGLSDPYPINNNSYFEVAIYGIKNSHINPLVTFDHKYISDTLHDGGYVEASFDKGKTWKNVVNDSSGYFGWLSGGGVTNFYKISDTITGKIPSFNGSSNGWIHSEVLWMWWVGVKSKSFGPDEDTLTLRFHFKSDNIQTNKSGWIIDNINIYNNELSSIDEITDNNSYLKIFPNPILESSLISLSKEQATMKSINIFDILGKCVFSENNLKEKSYSFHKGNLISGLYILKIEDSDGNIYSDKLIIN